MLRCLKGSIFASFFICLIQTSVFAEELIRVGESALLTTALSERALSQGLDQHPTWLALLHSKNGESRISDENFILSRSHFSSRNELLASIDVLFGRQLDAQYLCKFPARTLWLSTSLSLKSPDFSHCESFVEFKEKAPVDKVSLVYSSENLTQPSSMMGHVFLKLGGQGSDGHQVEHAVSYFTEITGINVPKIIFESLFLGKKGYFALSPYAEKEKYYLDAEQRNLWSYQLRLSPGQAELIQAHIWELKQARLEYFFQDYNCATLLTFLLGTAHSELLSEDELWITPLDLVKLVNQYKLVDQVTVIPANKWKLRMLSENLNDDVQQQIMNAITTQNFDVIKDRSFDSNAFLMAELTGSYLDYMLEQGTLAPNDWAQLTDTLNETRSTLSDDFSIDVSQYKNPLKTPPDSQVFGGFVYEQGTEKLKFGFLPTSHTLEDDNRQFFSENELKLGSLSLLYSPEKSRLELEEFELYSAVSLIPYDRFSGGVSGRFRFGIEQHYDEHLNNKSAVNIGGGIGLGQSFSQDGFFYGLLAGGVAATSEEEYLYLDPEIGMVLHEVFDMKSIISYQYLWNQRASKSDISSLKFVQSKFINQNFSVIFQYEHLWNDAQAEDRFELLSKYYF
ncbi:Lnb N-terminal periplasmic domain-containing protein [Litoribrevibacter albus]|uniref:DUF4105 domain-containing protein n=1 Tax=Litoribrevibacter albus TaxID=1473156 RepID=A0AA37SDT1_9GAMM|nr:DUF4105 domain-containing protein [Litoribrevibacter albus]GLQ33308.1 hypothetical protein GCM10007876_37880 [Litoribrevibacter albus]